MDSLETYDQSISGIFYFHCSEARVMQTCSKRSLVNDKVSEPDKYVAYELQCLLGLREHV